MKELEIVLLDYNKDMCTHWEKAFNGCTDVQVVCSDFESYVKSLTTNQEIFTIVSPGNSFGMMDGGYDLAITLFYIREYNFKIIDAVQRALNSIGLYREQPVGTSKYIKTTYPKPSLIHTPTMRYPMDISNTNNVYMCMKSTLGCACLQSETDGIGKLIIPAFGGACGRVPFEKIAYEMKLAYDRYKGISKVKTYNWSCISDEIGLQNK